MEAPCPSCGEETEGYGPRNLCARCYTDEAEFLEVPDEMAVERCKHCGWVHLGMNWAEAADERVMISKVLEHKIDAEQVTAVSFHMEDGDYHLHLLVEETVDGDTFQQEVETRIVVEDTQCKTCSKFEGGYYEYKIQLRGEHLDEVLDRMMERAVEMTDRNRENFVSNVEEEAGGYDLYLSSREMAEALLRVVREGYDMDEKRSKEIIGEDEGQRVYRSVVSARVN